jgi:hypothetical protein
MNIAKVQEQIKREGVTTNYLSAAQTTSVRYINPPDHGEASRLHARGRGQRPRPHEVRDKFVNVAAPPASTTLEVPKLAREGALLEVEGDTGRRNGAEAAPRNAGLSKFRWVDQRDGLGMQRQLSPAPDMPSIRLMWEMCQSTKSLAR